jgi:hypothetical protein
MHRLCDQPQTDCDGLLPTRQVVFLRPSGHAASALQFAWWEGNMRKVAIRNVLPQLSGSLAALLLSITICHAEVIIFRSELSAAAEVPPNPSTARGSAEVRLDTATRGLSWVIEYSGLTAPLRVAHFHGPASPTANAPILVPITLVGARPPLVGATTLSEQQIQDVLAGRWYINLHTGTYPSGEIRGQVIRK